MKKCPCKNCEKRCVGCHGNCDEYKDWALEKQALTKKMRDDKYYGWDNHRQPPAGKISNS